MGRPDDALAMFCDLLARREAVGSAPAQLLLAQCNIGCLLADKLLFDEAAVQYAVVSTGCVSLLGALHPFTIRARHNLAVSQLMSCRDGEDMSAAVSRLVSSLSDAVDVLGRAHLTTAVMSSNCAVVVAAIDVAGLEAPVRTALAEHASASEPLCGSCFGGDGLRRWCSAVDSGLVCLRRP